MWDNARLRLLPNSCVEIASAYHEDCQMTVGWRVTALCLVAAVLSGCMNPIEDAREEGYAAGYEDGFEEGAERGREEGHEEGLEEGRQEVLDCVESTDGSAEEAYYDCA